MTGPAQTPTGPDPTGTGPGPAAAPVDVTALAAELAGQSPASWHAAADAYATTATRLAAAAEDLADAHRVITVWPRSVGSLTEGEFTAAIDGGAAALHEWAGFSATMAAALRLGAEALDNAHAALPAIAEAFADAQRLLLQPGTGPVAATLAGQLGVVATGLIAAVGVALQAPTTVPVPSTGWPGRPLAGVSPVPATSGGAPVTRAATLAAATRVRLLSRRGHALTARVASLSRRRRRAPLTASLAPRLAGVEPSPPAPPPAAQTTNNANPPGTAPNTLLPPLLPACPVSTAGQLDVGIRPGLASAPSSGGTLSDPHTALLGRTEQHPSTRYGVATPAPPVVRLPGEAPAGLTEELFVPLGGGR